MLERDQIKFQIEILTEALNMGFASPSSPVEPLFEVVIDLLLKLRNQLQEGLSFWHGRKNPAIKFLDVADELANPKSIKIWDRREPAWDPRICQFIEQIVLDLTKIKRLKLLPEHLYCSDQAKKDHDKVNQKTYHFFRRARNRKKN